MNAPQINIEVAFRAVLAEYGLNPPEVIADGTLRRFDTNDDKKGEKSAWCVLHGDEVPAGAFGNWKTGLSEKWCSRPAGALTPVERAAYLAKIAQAHEAVKAKQMQLEEEAAAKCEQIFANASDASADNPYCVRKGISPFGLKEFKNKRMLLIPMRDGTGKLRSLQFIDADGTKRFKSHGRVQGSHYTFGEDTSETVLICEGFATGASLFAAIGSQVVVAFNANNLMAVAKAVRHKHPLAQIIVCADDDRFKPTGNVGMESATAAAKAVGGWLAFPKFYSHEGRPTDFNDLAQREGANAVIDAIALAKYLGPKADVPSKTANERQLSLPDNRVVTIRRGADIKPQPITWLWPGWLAAGKLSILAGAAGTGKTTLVLALAAVVTAGGPWPDGTVSHGKGNVLIWSSEDVADDTLVPRLIASGADLSRCYFIEGIAQNGESVPFDPSQDIAELHRAVQNIGGVSLLLIDPIVSAVAGDMHKANDVRRSLQALVDFADAHSCAVIGITHFAKGGAGRAPQDRVLGSQAFGALARMVLVTAKEEDGDRRVLARAKSNIAIDEGGIAYSIQPATLDSGISTTHAIWEGVVEGTAREILGEVEVDASPAGDSREDLKQMLTDTLKDAGGTMPVTALQAEVRNAGYSWDAAKRLKKQLDIDSFKVSMKGPWVWRMPLIGKSAAVKGSTKSTEERIANKPRASLSSAYSSDPNALPNGAVTEEL